MLAVHSNKTSFSINMDGNRKMEYGEFVDYLKKKYKDRVEFLLKGSTGDNLERHMMVKRINRQLLQVDCSILLADVLIMKSSGKIYNLEDLYHVYLKEDFLEVFSRSTGEHIGYLKTGPYKDVKDTFMIRIFNHNLHQEGLEDFVYQREGDLVFILYQYFGYKDKTVYARKVTKFEFDSWGDVTFEKVMADALKNTAKLFPPTVYHHDKKKEVDFLKDDSLTKENMMFFNSTVLLSNSVAIDGALALYYPGVLPKMMKIFDGPFDAVFMNVNDVMIFRSDDELTEFAAECAAEETEMGEMLSGKIYHCDETGVHPKAETIA